MSSDGEPEQPSVELAAIAQTVGGLASAVASIQATLAHLSTAQATAGAAPTAKIEDDPVDDSGEDSQTPQRDFGAYVPHGLYQRQLRSGFESILPSPESEDKPHIFHFSDPTVLQLEANRMREALDEYRLDTCYAYYVACANAASEEALGQGLAHLATAEMPEWVGRLVSSFQELLNTSIAVETILRDRMSYIRRAKRGNATADDKVFNELLREQTFEPASDHFGSSSHADLESAWRGEILRQKVLISAKETAKSKGKSSGKTEAEKAADRRKAEAKKRLDEQKAGGKKAAQTDA